jgi:AraC-like DNA-binding protein
LATTKRSATQIAADTGFCDLPHLIRVFRTAEGMTPEAFRRTARGLDEGAAGPGLSR